MTDILTWESDEIRELFDQLKKIEEGINLAKENYHPSIASDYYLTGEDVRRILHICFCAEILDVVDEQRRHRDRDQRIGDAPERNVGQRRKKHR